MNRQAFEIFISSPPFEKNIERFPNDGTKYPWPGAYRDITVELAWECWREATFAQGAQFEAQLAAAKAKNTELEKELFSLAWDVIYFENQTMPCEIVRKAKRIYEGICGKGE